MGISFFFCFFGITNNSLTNGVCTYVLVVFGHLTNVSYYYQIATRWYRAPEILLKSRKYSTPIDLWSVGCIFGEMVIGQPIFRALNCHDELEAIFR